MLSDIARQNILEFLDSLYCEFFGAYGVFPKESTYDCRLAHEYIISTYYVKKILFALGAEGRSINRWLYNTTDDLLDRKFELGSFSNSFHNMLELHRIMGLEVPKERFAPVIYKFESNLNKIDELRKKTILPIYFLDYLELSLLLGHNSLNYHELIIKNLTNEHGFDEQVLFFTLDTVSFYLAVRALYLVGYDLSNDSNLDIMFVEFSKFLMDEVTYIQPFYGDSSFFDTFYVNALMNILEIPLSEGIDNFYKSMLVQAVQASPYGLYMYLEILRQNDTLHILKPIEEKIIYTLPITLSYLLALDGPINRTIRPIIATIQSLEIMGLDWSIPDNQINYMLTDLKLEYTDDPFVRAVFLVEKIRFKNLVKPNENDLSILFEQLSEKLVCPDMAKNHNMVALGYMAVNAYIESSYIIPNDVIKVILNILYNARHPSGLFRGGSSIYDVRADFDTTYKALFMLELFQQIINERGS